jgi:hypothetical protein
VTADPSADSSADPNPDPPGAQRLADEALRLIEALRDVGGPQHAGPECRICPICRVIAAVRALRPEAVEHLAVAAAELATAWREVVSAVPPARQPAPDHREPPVERIDVTD